MSEKDHRRWLRRSVNPEKVYSELDPKALEAAVNLAEKLHKGHIHPPAISCAIREYIRLTNE